MKREQMPLWSENSQKTAGATKSSLDELRNKLIGIRNQGYIKTHRAHDTGIGKTLEDLLGIEENNISLPDIGDIELKSKRIESGSMLTIATKAPKPRGINRVLYENYKYLDEDGEYCLHSTACGSSPNNQSLQVTLTDERLILNNSKQIEAYWPISVFSEVLESKSGKILIVFAETKGKRQTEQFHFVEAFLLSNISMSKFTDAIKNDKLKIDTRIGTYKSGKSKGKYHDHGTGFRISRRDFLMLYDQYEQIL